MRELAFRVIGTPTPVGSFYARIIGKFVKPNLVQDPRAIIVPDNKKSAPWRQAVIAATKNAIRAQEFEWVPLSEAVRVEFTFLLERPKTVRRLMPWVKPDVDKLARNSLDGLTEAKVFLDDGQVCDLLTSKRYADGVPAGAQVRVIDMASVLL